jgi:hypothetical protein
VCRKSVEPAGRLMLDRETLSTNGGVQGVVALFAVSMLKLRATDCVVEVLLASTIVVDQPAPSATCGMICVSANAGSSPRIRKDTVKLGRDRIVIGFLQKNVDVD